MTVLEVGFSPDAGNHAHEYEPWIQEKINQELKKSEAKAPKSFTVEFNGIKYTGEFSGISPKVVPCNYIEYDYFKAKEFSFSINANTKELTGFDLIKKPDSEQTLDEAKCREIADNFVSKYIDINKYTIYTEIKEGSYKFSYKREISGLITSEALYITVDRGGNIVYFSTKMLHDFDNVIAVEFEETDLYAAIEEKLASIYEGIDNYESYEVRNYRLTKLENGRFGILCIIDAKFEREYSDGGSFQVPVTVIKLLITGATVKPAK